MVGRTTRGRAAASEVPEPVKVPAKRAAPGKRKEPTSTKGEPTSKRAKHEATPEPEPEQEDEEPAAKPAKKTPAPRARATRAKKAELPIEMEVEDEQPKKRATARAKTPKAPKGGKSKEDSAEVADAATPVSDVIVDIAEEIAPTTKRTTRRRGATPATEKDPTPAPEPAKAPAKRGRKAAVAEVAATIAEEETVEKTTGRGKRKATARQTKNAASQEVTSTVEEAVVLEEPSQDIVPTVGTDEAEPAPPTRGRRAAGARAKTPSKAASTRRSARIKTVTPEAVEAESTHDSEAPLEVKPNGTSESTNREPIAECKTESEIAAEPIAHSPEPVIGEKRKLSETVEEPEPVEASKRSKRSPSGDIAEPKPAPSKRGRGKAARGGAARGGARGGRKKAAKKDSSPVTESVEEVEEASVSAVKNSENEASAEGAPTHVEVETAITDDAMEGIESTSIEDIGERADSSSLRPEEEYDEIKLSDQETDAVDRNEKSATPELDSARVSTFLTKSHETEDVRQSSPIPQTDMDNQAVAVLTEATEHDSLEAGSDGASATEMVEQPKEESPIAETEKEEAKLDQAPVVLASETPKKEQAAVSGSSPPPLSPPQMVGESAVQEQAENVSEVPEPAEIEQTVAEVVEQTKHVEISAEAKPATPEPEVSTEDATIDTIILEDAAMDVLEKATAEEKAVEASVADSAEAIGEHSEQIEVGKMEIEKTEIEKMEVEKMEVEKMEVEKMEVEKMEVEQMEIEQMEVDQPGEVTAQLAEDTSADEDFFSPQKRILSPDLLDGSAISSTQGDVSVAEDVTIEGAEGTEKVTMIDEDEPPADDTFSGIKTLRTEHQEVSVKMTSTEIGEDSTIVTNEEDHTTTTEVEVTETIKAVASVNGAGVEEDSIMLSEFDTTLNRGDDSEDDELRPIGSSTPLPPKRVAQLKGMSPVRNGQPLFGSDASESSFEISELRGGPITANEEIKAFGGTESAQPFNWNEALAAEEPRTPPHGSPNQSHLSTVSDISPLRGGDCFDEYFSGKSSVGDSREYSPEMSSPPRAESEKMGLFKYSSTAKATPEDDSVDADVSNIDDSTLEAISPPGRTRTPLDEIHPPQTTPTTPPSTSIPKPPLRPRRSSVRTPIRPITNPRRRAAIPVPTAIQERRQTADLAARTRGNTALNGTARPRDYQEVHLPYPRQPSPEAAERAVLAERDRRRRKRIEAERGVTLGAGDESDFSPGRDMKGRRIRFLQKLEKREVPKLPFGGTPERGILKKKVELDEFGNVVGGKQVEEEVELSPESRGPVKVLKMIYLEEEEEVVDEEENEWEEMEDAGDGDFVV